MESYAPSVLEKRPQAEEERTGTPFRLSTLMREMGNNGAFLALPPDQITTFLSDTYSTNDRVLAWARKYTGDFTYRSPYCTAVPYEDSKPPGVNATRPRLRAADCARELHLSDATVSRSLRYWSERKLIQVDSNGTIRLNGAIPPNSDQTSARTNSSGPCPGVRVLLSPEELPEVEQLWSEIGSLEHKKIAQATKEIRQKAQQQRENIIAQRFGIRRIGRHQWIRENGNQFSHDSVENLEATVLAEASVHERCELQTKDNSRPTNDHVHEGEGPCTSLDSPCTRELISINRDVENKERKQLQQPVDSASPSEDDIIPNTSRQRTAELRAVLERQGFPAIGDGFLLKICRELRETPLDFFENWLRERLKQGPLRSGGLLLVASDARRRLTAEAAQRQIARRAAAAPNCGECYDHGYIGQAPGSNEVSEIRASIHAETIRLCTCEQARTIENLLRDD